MFERFTDEARRVVVLAQEESRELNHSYIGTEHLLLGLLRGEGSAAAALASLDVGLDAAREQVAEIVGRGQQAPSGHIPFTPRAKKVLELSLRESVRLGHPYIGSEHILLGLIAEGHGVAVEVLRILGAEPDRVRARVIELIPPAGEKSPGLPDPGRPVRLAVSAAKFDELLDRLDAIEPRLDAIEPRLDAIERRLDAIERRLGLGEPPAEAEPG